MSAYEASSGRMRDTPRMYNREAESKNPELHPEILHHQRMNYGLGRDAPSKQLQFDIYKKRPEVDVKPGMEWMHGGPKVAMNARTGNGKPTVVSNSVEGLLGNEEAMMYNKRHEGQFTAQEMAEARRVRARRSNASDPRMFGREEVQWENKRHAAAPDALGARPEVSMKFNESTNTSVCLHTDAPVFYDARNEAAPRLMKRPDPTYSSNKHHINMGDDPRYISEKRYITHGKMPEHKDVIRPEPSRYRLDDDIPMGRNLPNREPVINRQNLANNLPQHSFEAYNTKIKPALSFGNRPTQLW